MQMEGFKFSALRPEWIIFLAGMAFCVAQLAMGFSDPLMGEYSFRQTQTAISTYWIIKGGPWIAYQTPVLGSPWSIPFEFPLYQWFVAVLAKVMPFLSLDESGRIVSEFFFICLLWPMWRIASHQERGRSLFLISAGLLLLSPIYAFWSCSFMVESLVLFLSMWFIASLIDFLAAPSVYGFAEMVFTAILAASVKITTFVGFSFAGTLIVLYFMYRDRAAIKNPKQLVKYSATAIAVALSVLALWVWVHYSDSLKSENLIGRFYTGAALKNWNFGTLAQRKSLDLMKVIVMRAPNEALGSWRVGAAITLIAAIKMPRSQFPNYLALLGLYVAPFFVFTNLHLVHHYYQYANSIFLVLSAGYLVYTLLPTKPLMAYAVVALIALSQIYGYWRYFYQDLVLPNRELQILLADYLRQNTRPADALVGFGLDWSSEVPYYAERRALLVPDAVSAEALNTIASNPFTFTGGARIGAVIICPNELTGDPKKRSSYARLVNTVTLDLKPHLIGYCTVFS